MLNVSHFARIYDELTYDMPYELWVEIINYYGQKANSYLELGVGTGNITKRLNFKEMYAIDISEDMVNIVKEKLPNLNVSVGDVKTFNLNRTFDLITANVDVLNYLKDESEMIQTLNNVYKQLNKDGIFIFDIHGIYKMNHDFNNMTYADETENVSYIWHAIQEEPMSVVHELTFFVKQTNGFYNRFTESHDQKTYSHVDMIQMINETNFTIINTFSDFDINHAVTDDCDRVFYVLQKLCN